MQEQPLVNRARACLYLDFYGVLLTPRMRQLLELYYAEDMSLGEISLQLSISRQAVNDAVRRGVKLLEGYENKLSMVDQHFMSKTRISTLQLAIEKSDIDELRTMVNKWADDYN